MKHNMYFKTSSNIEKKFYFIVDHECNYEGGFYKEENEKITGEKLIVEKFKTSLIFQKIF